MQQHCVLTFSVFQLPSTNLQMSPVNPNSQSNAKARKVFLKPALSGKAKQ